MPTHYRTIARYGYNGATSFNYSKAFYSDSSCTTAVYLSDSSGTFAVAAATTTPANGYAITYSMTDSYVLAYGTTARTAIKSGCSSNVSWTDSGNNVLGLVYSNFNCTNITISAAPATLYNVVVSSDTTLNIGTPDGDNPGVTNANAIGTTAPITFTK